MKQTYVFSAQKTRHETFQKSAMLESALSLSIWLRDAARDPFLMSL